MSDFNAARARAKRPCPLWVDAFQRDTQHLAADEVGAYMLILMAMWTRETCDYPDDDRRLSAVSRVSTRLWKSRIGPVIREFLKAENGMLISQRLRKEATYIERQCSAQSNRKNNEKSDNPLKNNKQGQTADNSTDNSADSSADHPSQQPNNLHKIDDDAGASARVHLPDNDPPPKWGGLDREKLLSAIGVDPISGLTGPNGRMLGGIADMQVAGGWVSDLGLSQVEILAIIGEVMARKSDGPPSTFKYFTGAMAELAGRKAAPKITPASPGTVSPERPKPDWQKTDEEREDEKKLAFYRRVLAKHEQQEAEQQ